MVAPHLPPRGGGRGQTEDVTVIREFFKAEPPLESPSSKSYARDTLFTTPQMRSGNEIHPNLSPLRGVKALGGGGSKRPQANSQDG